MIVNCDEVSATKPRIHLSTVCKSEARGATFALGQVEYPVRKQDAGGIIARNKSATPNPEYLYNELGQVAAFLGQVTGALGGRARLGRGEPSGDQQYLSEWDRQFELARVALS